MLVNHDRDASHPGTLRQELSIFRVLLNTIKKLSYLLIMNLIVSSSCTAYLFKYAEVLGAAKFDSLIYNF
jgi:hypothetical protein